MARRFDTLFQLIPGSSLGFFRIVFGLIVLWELARHLMFGWVTKYYIAPEFNFRYTLFDWLAPLPGQGMVYLHYGLAALALLVTVGLFYRFAIIGLFVGLSYVFLLEETRYLNHSYLVCLFALLLCFIPANRALSLEARLNRDRPSTLPLWSLWLLRVQIGIPYFFGGIAKLNPDWLRGEPMRTWLARETDFPLIGGLFALEPTVIFMTYGGLLLDLLAFPLLLFRRTRTPTFIVLTLFHMMNARLFSIGIFPWLMMLATTLFYPPDWPARLWQRWRLGSSAYRLTLLGSGLFTSFLSVAVLGHPELFPLLASFVTGVVIAWGWRENAAPVSPQPRTVPDWRRGVVLSLLACWLLVSVSLPLRHFFLPGRASWTEEGHRFAWRMMLHNKLGRTTFTVRDPASGQQESFEARDILPDWQAKEMVDAPHMILQFAHHTAERFAAIGYPEVEVYVIAEASLNGREPELLIDPEVNLAAQPKSLRHAGWILPLTEPLPGATVAVQANP